MEKGNVIYDHEWQFWLVVFIQIICIVMIPAAIQNIMAHKK
jgi:hypothetical protein